MPWTRVEVDTYLAALDTGLVMMRAQLRSRDELLAAFDTVAARLRAGAGPHGDHVSARLDAILIANGLGPDTQDKGP
jgi:hypothetical protein